MIKKTDIVSLKWVIKLMNTQADNAEAALVEYGNDPNQKQALLRCMWSVHQITSTLRALGMSKAEMLTLEMERTLNFLYKDKVVGERRKLAMGGLMQALKVIPAYLEHTENVRLDTGRGLEKYVNDLRRWVGEKPRSKAYFFHMTIAPETGITEGGSPASDEEIKQRANVMLALYLEMAKQGLRKRKISESMVNVARVARKMQTMFAGTITERFWFAMIGLCEGLAGGLIQPDECIAQIFKSGAFTIKQAREHGAEIDESIDYDAYLQQMLYYVAACKSRPVHITAIRKAFGINDNTLAEASHGLVHSDALVIALTGAMEYLDKVVEFLSTNDLAEMARGESGEVDTGILDSIEAAEYRLIAAGQLEHSDSLRTVQQKLGTFLKSGGKMSASGVETAVQEITKAIVTVRQDVEHKLNHGLNSTYSGTEIESRESVAAATFRLMGLVENHLHQILRRQALARALESKPEDPRSVLELTVALNRFLNKSEQGHEELRAAVREVDAGDGDVGKLYELALGYFSELDTLSEEDTINESLQLLQEIADALMFSGMQREGAVMEQCQRWLFSANRAGSVSEDEAFRCFADAFAHIEMHLQRSLLDPQDDTSHMLAIAEQRAEKLGQWIPDDLTVETVNTETAEAVKVSGESAVAAAPAVEEAPVEEESAVEEILAEEAPTAGQADVGESPEVEEIVVEAAPAAAGGEQEAEPAELALEPPAEAAGAGDETPETQGLEAGSIAKAILANAQLAEEKLVEDADIPPEFFEVFVEESEEIVAELSQLTPAWLEDPCINETLKDMRRHFHTFKGNGRAVGANILGELGWAAQDMLDRTLDGELDPTESVQKLVGEVVEALPALVSSYAGDGEPDIERIRELTRACFVMAEDGAQGAFDTLTH